ncbi:AI-2E family transporter [Candidatus Peregrinibacteria bacterium]|nr:AI-2E family transporter [Candidatus Peregrinibacteria bacterium]
MPLHKALTIDLQKYFFIILLALFLVLFFYFISPFLGTVVIAAVIVTGCNPFQRALLKRMPRFPTVATFLTMILVTVILLVPIGFLLFLIAHQAGEAYGLISGNVNHFFSQEFTLLPEKIANSSVGKWLNSIGQYAPLTADDISRNIQEMASRVSGFLVAQTTTVLKNFSYVLLQLIVFFLALFYFLRDGEKLISTIRSLLPLPKQYRRELFIKLNTLSHSIIYGIFGAAVVQGFLAGLGFYLAGIPNAAFWGTVMAFFSPVPYIGTAIIWVPTVIFLAVQGIMWPTVFLLLWCVFVVGLSDNLVKPYLIGEANAIHPLMVLLVILGGVFVFGLQGVLFGPFLLSLMLTFLHIYRLEYKDMLDKD